MLFNKKKLIRIYVQLQICLTRSLYRWIVIQKAKRIGQQMGFLKLRITISQNNRLAENREIKVCITSLNSHFWIIKPSPRSGVNLSRFLACQDVNIPCLVDMQSISLVSNCGAIGDTWEQALHDDWRTHENMRVKKIKKFLAAQRRSKYLFCLQPQMQNYLKHLHQ